LADFFGKPSHLVKLIKLNWIVKQKSLVSILQQLSEVQHM